MPEPSRGKLIARYVRDTLVLLVALGLLGVFVWFGYIAWRDADKVKKATIKCPACGAELELRKAGERSEK